MNGIREKRIFPSVILKSITTRWGEDNDYVLLDLLEDDPVLPEQDPVSIESEFFQVVQENTVRVPTLEALLGDKLTALAPETIGIPYGEEREVDIIKQLFDVGMLFRESSSVKEAHQAYRSRHAKQNKYLGSDYSVRETLRDTLEVCEWIAHYRLKEKPDTETFRELDAGIDGLENHLLWRNFNQHDATVISSQVALVVGLLASKCFNRSFNEFEYDENEIKDVKIEGAYDHLNHLKKREPEAFYYWWKTSQILESRESFL